MATCRRGTLRLSLPVVSLPSKLAHARYVESPAMEGRGHLDVNIQTRYNARSGAS